MTTVHMYQKNSTKFPTRYYYRVISPNGRFLVESKLYNTKFHCKAAAEWLFPTFTIIDHVKDRRKRA